MLTPIRLIVGLGNPGFQYAATRHNAGDWFVRQLCAQYQGTLRETPRFHGLHTRFTTEAHLIQALIPTTFMNQSGRAVRALTHFYKVPIDAILVAHDDLDLPVGSIRLKYGGGAGGHNGVRNIMDTLGGIVHKGQGFWRLRIGIGHPGQRDRVQAYVLSAPTPTETARIQAALSEAHTVWPTLVRGAYEAALQHLHRLTI